MSVKESLWEVNIPGRKVAYAVLYIGLLLSMTAIFLLPSYLFATFVGMGLILGSAVYISVRLYRAGYRRHSILFFLFIMLLCGASIAALILLRSELL